MTDDGDSRVATDGDAPEDPSCHRAAVRDRYAAVATGADTACCESPTEDGPVDDAATDGACCSDEPGVDATDAERMGYSGTDLQSVADGANLGLGCGNPKALAALDPGETVLDLGSGAGFDCFLAAQEVGPEGRVVGVDMTPEMIERARRNAERTDATNVSFRLGEIEHLPVADGTVDVVISNCVINLSPDKPRVFREAFRVLRPGGRVALADVVQTARLPDELRGDREALTGCVAGAATIDDLEASLSAAGFVDVTVEPVEDSRELIREWSAEHDLDQYLLSASITARKPDRPDES